MRTYEVLIDKANNCRLAAMRTRGAVSRMWFKKALELEAEVTRMSVEKAMSIYINEKKLQRGF